MSLSSGFDARFATTQWSVVLAAGGSGGDAEAALARLCSLYWYPVFAFVRRRGYAAEDAQDLTQGFFTRLLDKGDLGDADRSRGRFRTFLLTSCQHFLSNERDRSQALKRGGGEPFLSIDGAAAERRYERALAHGETPERLYDRQWCVALLESVLEALRQEYAVGGNEALFDRLSRFLTVKIIGGQASKLYFRACRGGATLLISSGTPSSGPLPRLVRDSSNHTTHGSTTSPGASGRNLACHQPRKRT